MADMTREEAHARWICCTMCDKKKCEREANDCDVKIYLKNKAEEELNAVRQELLNRPDQYITFKDLVERFDEIDEAYNHSPWNLLQIYSNFNILIGTEREDKE